MNSSHSLQFTSDNNGCVCVCFSLLEQGQHSDVKFLVHGQIFPAHRCVLSVRSEYFSEMFNSKWSGKNLITLKHPLVQTNFVACIHVLSRMYHKSVCKTFFFLFFLDQPCGVCSNLAIYLYRLVCFHYNCNHSFYLSTRHFWIWSLFK